MIPSVDAERLIDRLGQLVAFDSQNPPGCEEPAARRIAEWLTEAGYKVEIDELAPGRTNVIARLDNGPGPVFGFNTHIDVVPVGDGWASEPLTLTGRDGNLYGRGSCDAKGPLAAMVEAMRLLALSRDAWSGTVLGVFVADEEVGSAGARRYAASKPVIDYAVVGEPTSLRVISAHKGSLRPIVRVEGTTAHSGTPELGDNAIFRAGQLLELIAALHRDAISQRSHPLCGRASLTVTRINGGQADNVIPGSCELLLDRRMVPGEDEEVVKAEIIALLDGARESHGIRASVIGYKVTTGGSAETPVDHPLILASLDACRPHCEGAPGPFGFEGACDMVHFRNAGAMVAVVGPGSLAVAHKPDEFVPIRELVACADIYRDIALRMLPVGARGNGDAQ